MAYDFETSSSQYISYGTENLIGDSAPWSVLATVRFESFNAGTATTIISKRDGWGNGSDKFNFECQDSGELSITCGGRFYVATTNFLSTGTLYRVAATCDGTSVIFFVNGETETDANNYVTASGADAATLRIGAHSSTPEDFMDGSLQDIAVYKCKLHPFEVLRYTLGHQSPETIRRGEGLYYFPFNGHVEDVWGNTIRGTISGGPIAMARHEPLAPEIEPYLAMELAAAAPAPTFTPYVIMY